MTEDEKKEFEEFLQWKKEKQKKAMLEQQRTEEHSERSECLEKTDGEQVQVNISKNDAKQPSDSSAHFAKQNKKVNRVIWGLGLVVLFWLIYALVSLENGRYRENAQHETNQGATLAQSIEDSVYNAKADSVDSVMKARADSIKESRRLKRIDLLKHSVRITTARLSSPNSAGGVDAIVYYKNLSNKTIKYFNWEGYAKNAVGDIVENEIGGREFFRGKDTGPIKHGKTGGGCWDCIIYNWTAKKLVITEVTIEYMDGTELKISENEIKYIR